MVLWGLAPAMVLITAAYSFGLGKYDPNIEDVVGGHLNAVLAIMVLIQVSWAIGLTHGQDLGRAKRVGLVVFFTIAALWVNGVIAFTGCMCAGSTLGIEPVV